jgi:hypothetical protein
MHFGIKSYLKSNRNHTAKQTLSYLSRTSLAYDAKGIILIVAIFLVTKYIFLLFTNFEKLLGHKNKTLSQKYFL